MIGKACAEGAVEADILLGKLRILSRGKPIAKLFPIQLYNGHAHWNGKKPDALFRLALPQHSSASLKAG